MRFFASFMSLGSNLRQRRARCIGDQAPSWFNDGLAAVLADSRYEDGVWNLGLLAPYFKRRLARQIYDKHFPAGLAELVSNEDYSGLFSWTLVYWLLTRHEVGDVLDFARRSQTMPPIEAWEVTLGPIGTSQEEEFRRFLKFLTTGKAEKRWKNGVHQERPRFTVGPSR